MRSRFKTTLVLLLAAGVQACSLSSHRIIASDLGVPTSMERMEQALDVPGPVSVETIDSCDWAVDLGGLLDLGSSEARAAGLRDRLEPIHVYVHVLRHPRQGSFLIDTGVARAVAEDPSAAGVAWPVRRFLGGMTLRASTGEVLARIPGGVQGVFFTHLHIDHISGMPEVPAGVPLYVGRGEARHASLQNLFVRGTTDRLLQGKSDLREWPFELDPATGSVRMGEVLDIFGDGTVYAISVPGHTQGSTAYLARTANGPVLLTGDVSHTRWGWENGVAPGSYTEDADANRASLRLLRAIAARHPGLDVRLGHQDRAPGVSAGVAAGKEPLRR